MFPCMSPIKCILIIGELESAEGHSGLFLLSVAGDITGGR